MAKTKYGKYIISGSKPPPLPPDAPPRGDIGTGVVHVDDDVIKGEEPVALVVLEPVYEPSSRIKVEIKNLIRESIGTVATPRNIRFVPMLPRAKNGRYMKKVLRAVCEKQDLSASSISENGASAEEVQEAIRGAREMLEVATD